jgi:molecular chaperone HscB
MIDLTKNFFELFGLDACYTLDAEKLSARYRELQRVVHPDRYAGGSEQERRLSMQGATLVNEAYETLRDPVARGRYLLQLLGADPDQGDSQHDPAFLMEQMELREELAEARHQPDPYRAIANIMAGINKRINKLVAAMAVAMEEGGEQGQQQAADILRKMQFLKKLRQDAENLEAELDDTL